jgi:hypothetical protein
MISIQVERPLAFQDMDENSQPRPHMRALVEIGSRIFASPPSQIRTPELLMLRWAPPPGKRFYSMIGDDGLTPRERAKHVRDESRRDVHGDDA